MKKIALAAFSATALLALSACGDAAEEAPAEDTTVVDTTVEATPAAEDTTAAAEATDAPMAEETAAATEEAPAE